MKHQLRQENLLYLALWTTLFVAPVLSMYIHSVSDSFYTFQWHDLWMIWPKFLVFLALFLIHNFLLAPILIHKNKRWQYSLITISIIALFTLYQCTSRPAPPPHHAPEPSHMAPPAIVGEHDIMAVIILILMFGMNLGIKGYYRHRYDERRMASLEKKNLEHQLEYLKYQINPHFLMNTLNNIHALVDIDPEKAKSTIVELSKMMRFVLYEGNKQGVPLSREFDFIRHYVALMQLRFTDKVKISLDLPQMAPDRQIPPLILITFIENAFKHGVSYKHDSFITIKAIAAAGRLQFECRNTKTEQPNQEKGGVGLRNVRQRLDLLFDENYTLRIQDEAEIYSVELEIPLT